MLQTLVKVSNISNLSDARYCAGMGVEFLGFSIDKNSDNYVSPQKLREIRSWVVGVQIVVETIATDSENLLETLLEYQADAIQISHAPWLPWLKSELNKPLIFSVEAQQDADTIADVLQDNVNYADYFLLESTTQTTLNGDWPDFLKTLAKTYPIFLGFGITADAINDLLETTPVAGIALKGSVELRPGYSEFGELMDVLEVLSV